jgi:hypothetical protein
MIRAWHLGAFLLVAACTTFGVAEPSDAGSQAETSPPDAGSQAEASVGCVFCENFERQESKTSPFGFESSMPSRSPAIEVVRDDSPGSSNWVLQVTVNSGTVRQAGDVVGLGKSLEPKSYALSYRFRVLSGQCEYAVLGGLMAAFAPMGLGVPGGATLCRNGSQFAQNQCVEAFPSEPGWHTAKMTLSAPSKTSDQSTTLSIDNRPPIEAKVKADRNRAFVWLFVGPFYISESCNNLRVQYDDIVLRTN